MEEKMLSRYELYFYDMELFQNIDEYVEESKLWKVGKCQTAMEPASHDSNQWKFLLLSLNTKKVLLVKLLGDRGGVGHRNVSLVPFQKETK